MNLLDFIKDLAYKEPLPNKYTIFLGGQIKKAREEAGMNQEELAEKLDKTRATVSNIETGKGEVNASTLALLAHIFNKPLGYFYPDYLYQEVKQESLSPIEVELITNFRYNIGSDHLGKLVIEFIKNLGEFDTNSFVIEQAPHVKDFLKYQKEFEKFLEKRKKVEVNK